MKQYYGISALILAFFSAVSNLASATEATIGPMKDGETYSIVSRTELSKSTTECGYNEFSIPQLGIFERQIRQYQEIKDNKVVRRWIDTVDILITCYSP